MIVRAFPLFEKGAILRTEMLSELAEHAYRFGDLLHEGQSDGVVAGCRLTTTKDSIIVNPGVVLSGGRVYLIKEPAFVSYAPTNATVVLKLEFHGESRSDSFIFHDVELTLDTDTASREGQLELCRFKLQPGAYLRYEYTDFNDRATEYDTLNTLHVPYSSGGRATLSPEISFAFAEELMGTRPSDPLDAAFCLQALDRSRPVAAETIAGYLALRLGEPMDNFSSNGKLYDGLRRVLMEAKRGGGKARESVRPRRKVLVE